MKTGIMMKGMKKRRNSRKGLRKGKKYRRKSRQYSNRQRKTTVTIDRSILGKRCRRWLVFSLQKRRLPEKMLRLNI